jgi:alkylation response protein AidB-like acyl-CoA dehydrogenase
MTSKPATDQEAADRVVAGATQLSHYLLARAHEIEAAGRLPGDVAAALADAGLFAVTMPRAMGGLGLSPGVMWRVAIEIGRGCASCAWLVGLNGANLLMVGKFPHQAQKDVFLCGKPAIVPLLTGGVGRDITVARADGGHRVSGTWHYASGIDVASWVGLLVPVPGDDGAAVDSVVLVEQAAFAIDHESWTTLGMRGTGSKTVRLDGAFVPHHRRMAWSDLQAGRVAPDCPNDEPLYRLPLTGVFAMSVLAPTLGVASGIVDEFRAVVDGRMRAGTAERQRDDRMTQIRVSETETWMQILRGQLAADADWLLRRTAADRPLTLPERAALRSRIAVCARQALTVCQTVFAAVGGTILPAPSRLERGLRDIHGMASHFLLQPDQIGEINGRALLGLDLPPSARL